MDEAEQEPLLPKDGPRPVKSGSLDNYTVQVGKEDRVGGAQAYVAKLREENATKRKLNLTTYVAS